MTTALLPFSKRAVASMLASLVGALGLVVLAASPSSASPVVADSGCSAHTLTRNDDGSTGLVSLPFHLNFYGHSYSSLYVNNNGNVTFQAPMGTFTPYTIKADTPPLIAPFFADVDTRNPLSHQVTYGVTTFEGHNAFCVNWSRVGYFAGRIDRSNSFQLLLVQLNAQGDFKIVFNYAQIGWETGEASGGTDGLGGTPAGAGFSAGDNVAGHFVELTGSLQNGAFLNGGPHALASGSNLNPAVPGRYAFAISGGTTQTGTTTACTPYQFVALVGSGQDSSYFHQAPWDTPSSRAGMDPRFETSIIFDALAAKYSGTATEVTPYQIPYKALSTDVLTENMDGKDWLAKKDQFFNKNLPKYMASVQDGVDKTVAYTNKVRSECRAEHRTTKFLIVGYSQGSLVIHKLLLGAQRWFAGEVGYVGLVADPAAAWHRHELFNWGTSKDSDIGVCESAWEITNNDVCKTKRSDLPAEYHGVTESLCNVQDPVCSTSTILGGDPRGIIARFKASVPNHMYSKTSPDLLKLMGKRIAVMNHLS